MPEGPRDRGDCRECAQLGGSSSSAPSRLKPIPWTKWAKWRWTALAPALLVSLSRAKRTKLKKAWDGTEDRCTDDVKTSENT